MKKEYTTPNLQIVQVKIGSGLLAGSVSENTNGAQEMSSGSFNSRQSGGFWGNED